MAKLRFLAALLVMSAMAFSLIVPTAAEEGGDAAPVEWSTTGEPCEPVPEVLPQMASLDTAIQQIFERASPDSVAVLIEQREGAHFSTTGEYSQFVDLLDANGYSVSIITTGSLTNTILAEYDVFIAMTQQVYTSAEISALNIFVDSGGGLFVIADHSSTFSDPVQSLTEAFGVHLDANVVHDTDDWVDPYDYWVTYDTANFASHPITIGLSKIQTFCASSMTGGTTIVKTDADGSATPGDSPVVVATSYGSGRVVVVADLNCFNNEHGFDLVQYPSDNKQFALNILDWLGIGGEAGPWVEVKTNGGCIYIDDNGNPSPSKVKCLPNGWVLKRLKDSNGFIEKEIAGVVWWNVIDVTDEVTGWVREDDLNWNQSKQAEWEDRTKIVVRGYNSDPIIPTDFEFEEDLKKGDQDDEASSDIKYLQLILKAEVGDPDYPSDTGATGYYGVVTEYCVSKFQQKYGIAPTGRLDSATRQKLNEFLAEGKYELSSSRASIILDAINHYYNNNDGIPAGFTGFQQSRLVYGQSNDDIRWFQKILKSEVGIPYYPDNIGATGYFGDVTKNSLKEFQIVHDLDGMDGVVGPETVEALNALLPQYMIETSELYSSNDGDNHLSVFKENAFPMELTLAMADVETGIIWKKQKGDWVESGYWFDNEIVTYDCGRGIMQITSNEYVGLGSGITFYCEGAVCYPYSYNDQNQACGSSPSCVTGRCLCYHDNGFMGRTYTNSVQGIYANIKDGLRALQDKWSASYNNYKQCCSENGEWNEETIITDKRGRPTGITCRELRWISTVKRYGPTDYSKYLGFVSERLVAGKDTKTLQDGYGFTYEDPDLVEDVANKLTQCASKSSGIQLL